MRDGRQPPRSRRVGDISLNFELLELAADPGLTILTYTAEPGSRDAAALKLHGS